MRRHRRNKNNVLKLGSLFIIIILSLATISASYAHWEETLQIKADMKTGTWGGSCIKIRKLVDKGCPISKYTCDKYYLTIEVMNNGTDDLTNVNVTDTLGSKISKTNYLQSTGKVYWSGKFFRWDIGNLAAGKTETLIICFTVNFDCCSYVESYITYPSATSGSTHPITRIEEDGDVITVYYKVVYDISEYNHRVVKFENCIYENGEEANLGEDGKVETDTFVINVLGGYDAVRVKEKAGTKWGYSNLIGVGDTAVDENGFTIKLVSITDIGGGQKQYTITVTSDNVPGGGCGGTKALSLIKFDFGATCTADVNNGATVTAKSIYCDLEATTDKLYIYKIRFNKNCPEWVYEILYKYETSWAWDCCEVCCDC